MLAFSLQLNLGKLLLVKNSWFYCFVRSIHAFSCTYYGPSRGQRQAKQGIPTSLSLPTLSSSAPGDLSWGVPVARWDLWSLQGLLDLAWGLLPVGRAQKNLQKWAPRRHQTLELPRLAPFLLWLILKSFERIDRNLNFSVSKEAQ